MKPASSTFAPPNAEISIIASAKTEIRSSWNAGLVVMRDAWKGMPQETIDEARAATFAAEEIACLAFVGYISCVMYRSIVEEGDQELRASAVCFTAAIDPEASFALRWARLAEESYHRALLHFSTMVEIPDDDDDDLLVATEGTVER